MATNNGTFGWMVTYVCQGQRVVGRIDDGAKPYEIYYFDIPYNYVNLN